MPMYACLSCDWEKEMAEQEMKELGTCPICLSKEELYRVVSIASEEEFFVSVFPRLSKEDQEKILKAMEHLKELPETQLSPLRRLPY